ncbi:MAG: TrkH family potassium uptake protein [Bacteroidales bacterium]|nr:TrkH family potassium uptake protein [Bacteroidales bacterium]
MNLKVISRNVGFALLVSALFMFLSVIVSLKNGHDSALAALLISFTITFIAGAFPFIFVRHNEVITLKDGYLIIFLSWMLSFIFGMLPYLLWGGPFTVINAWFESVSGFTTTGSSILENIEALPDSLLFWRSSTHFIGGLGVVVFLLLIIPSSSPVKLRLANMELSKLSKDGYMARANKTVYIFTYVYIGLAVSAFLAYWIAGMSPFDAINHAFSVCATGGFSTKNLSIAAFHSPAINIITIIFMIVGSIHFGIIFMVFVTRSFKPLKNKVLRFYITTIAVCALIVAFSLKIEGIEKTWGDAFMSGVFQVSAYASTTGFAISDNSLWPLLPCIILMFVGIQCGMSGSTSGGIKSDRMLYLVKAMSRQIRRTINPSSVNKIKVGDKFFSDEEVFPHILYITIFLLFIVISMVLCLIFGTNNYNALSGTIASLANVGLALGEIGSAGNYNCEPSMVKFIYTLDMLLGRLEIYPVIAALSILLKRNKKFVRKADADN